MKLKARSYIQSVILAILVALMVRSFVVTAYRVPTGSMIPTLKPGDLILSNRLAYGLEIPFHRTTKFFTTLPTIGDVVVFTFPDKPEVKYVKRVVGLPGDHILVREGRLIINGNAIEYDKLNPNQIADIPGNEYLEVLNEKLDTQHSVVFQSQYQHESFGPTVVPPNHVFLIGDNRDSSDDSRHFGAVPLENIEGKVFLTILSFNWHDRWAEHRFPKVRWDRSFSVIK